MTTADGNLAVVGHQGECDVVFGLEYTHRGRTTYRSVTAFVPTGATLLQYLISARGANGHMSRLVAMTFEGSSVIARYNDEERAAAYREGFRAGKRHVRRRIRKRLGL